ncbi:zinc-binding dehydrogenase [Kovacikia minuta CCNUW1]|uniref:quinone oxidoreductase family protein n=1 Tax=Kovacikia minuta TaxID=2931930 RepID=UPI001CCA7288|nr:zinc-binding dehydrogenase [Kovacikia minuta]UBF29165.1 zinc-binding dehydrogenase [Kovacikia minuta CCNUW1]
MRLNSMKAIVLEKTGGLDVLAVTQVPTPQPGANEVLIRIHCVGVNYADILSRQGLYNWANKIPYILGLESSGTVAAIGSNVRKFEVGDRVVVGSKNGNYAEFIVQPEDGVLPAPETLDFPELACLCGNWMTAWIALFELARMRSGEIALIQSGAGGVGTAAIQLAVSLGMRVYATSSTPGKMEYIRSLGATPLSYEEFDGVLATHPPDFILESVGGEVHRRSLNLLAPLGRLVTIGASSIRVNQLNPFSWYNAWRNLPKVSSKDLNSQAYMTLHVGFLLEDHRERIVPIWTRMVEYMTEHGLKPIVQPAFIYPMSEVRTAHQVIETRKNIGKVILDPSR